jgi:transcriptional regulator with XRE-family HTH domain
MTATLNDWIEIESQESEQTSGATPLVVASLFCALATVGTGGGHLHPHHIKTLQKTGAPIRVDLDQHSAQAQNAFAARIGATQSALNLSISQLAKLYGVSRPTVYGWLEGKPLSESNQQLVGRTWEALEPHLAYLENQTGRIGIRTIDGKSTAVDLIASGGDPAIVIHKLVQLLTEEQRQSDLLGSRLQKRLVARGEARDQLRLD